MQQVNSLPAIESERKLQIAQPKNLKPQPATIIARLWVWMGDIFGSLWNQNFGEDPESDTGKLWAHGLAGLTLEQLRHGIAELKHSESNFPPSMPVFRRTCIGIPSLAWVSFHFGLQPRTGFLALVEHFLRIDEFSRVDQRTAERMLRDAYSLAVDACSRMGEIVEPPRKQQREVVSMHPEYCLCSNCEKSR